MTTKKAPNVQRVSRLASGNPHLSSLAADPAGKLDILGHDGNPLGVDGAKVAVLKERYKIGLCALLKSENGAGLEPEVGLEVLGNLANKALEREPSDQQLSALLVLANLAQSNGPWAEAMGLLEEARRSSMRLSAVLAHLLFARKVLAGSLSTGRFTCGLFRSCHTVFLFRVR